MKVLIEKGLMNENINTDIYLCMYVYMYVCMYICMYIYTYHDTFVNRSKMEATIIIRINTSQEKRA